MEYIHIKSGKPYQFITQALFQNEKGEWVDCVVYRGEDRDKTFVRLQKDFEKSFNKRTYTLEELNKMEIDVNLGLADIYKSNGAITPIDSIRYIDRMKFIEYQKEQLNNGKR